MMSNRFFYLGDNDPTEIKSVNDKTPWVEDVFAGKEQPSENFISSNFELNKLKWLLISVIVFFLLIVIRIAYLQLIVGDEFRLAAKENRIRIIEIKAPRGIIYDRNKIPLVSNIPNFIVYFTPADLPENNEEKVALISKISDILEISYNELYYIISQAPEYSYQKFILAEHIPYEKAILLRIASTNLAGINFDAVSFREYAVSNNFSHLLGYMGKVTPKDLEGDSDLSYDDSIGKMGLELYYNDLLRGEHGKKEIEVNSLGKESKVVNISQPKAGKGLILAIDRGLQDVLGEELEKAVNKNKSATGAAAIAMDPNNGEVLAMVSNPTFSSNDFTIGLDTDEYQEIVSNPQKPLFNRSITGEYPSGSTIKPIVALAALEYGIIDEQTTFLSTGGIKIDKWFFPDWKAGGHGLTDVRKAIAESVNTFFYMIGGGNEEFTGLGVKKMTDFMRQYNLGATLGIDLYGEATGFLPSKEWKVKTKNEKWYIGDTYHLSIGQGDILVTPLQVASYTATIANEGSLYQPRLVKSYISADKSEIEEVEPVIINKNMANDYYYKIIKEGLRQAVLSGSAQAMQSLSVSSAGKTGTAQFGAADETHAWFTSFAPYESPEIVITVVVEGGGDGHATALPIAKKGYEYWFNK